MHTPLPKSFIISIPPFLQITLSMYMYMYMHTPLPPPQPQSLRLKYINATDLEKSNQCFANG